MADLSPSVREKVALHGRPQDLDKLAGDDAWEVRRAVASVCRDEHLLDRLARDKSPAVREAAACSTHDPRTLALLASDRSPLVRAAVAEHGHPELLDRLENDRDVTVRAAVRRVRKYLAATDIERRHSAETRRWWERYGEEHAR